MIDDIWTKTAKTKTYIMPYSLKRLVKPGSLMDSYVNYD